MLIHSFLHFLSKTYWEPAIDHKVQYVPEIPSQPAPLLPFTLEAQRPGVETNMQNDDLKRVS